MGDVQLKSLNMSTHTKLVIFGITGDLSRRKLIPALREVSRSNEVGNLEIIGVSRRDFDATELVGKELASITRGISMDLLNDSDYKRLYQECSVENGAQVVIYLSVPPLAVTQIVKHLGDAGFGKKNVKLLLEKPFGVDGSSAEEIIEEIRQYFNEKNIYRIDHYLAKEMAQNIISFRASNALFSHIWNHKFIERVEVIASEKIGIEGRADFYEQTGALRDVLQGHLMQLLALVLTEVPDELDWNDLPALRAKALQALEPVIATESIRGQYATYQDEVNNPGSSIETYVSVELHSVDPEWKNTRFILATGKGLDQKTTEVRIHFRKTHDAQRNCLRFRIQPNEGVEIDLFAKKPGYDREFEPQTLSFSYPPDKVLPDAYEQVLVDAIRSNKSIFASSEEILASWRVLQPLLDAWSMDELPLTIYSSGSSIGTDYYPVMNPLQ